MHSAVHSLAEGKLVPTSTNRGVSCMGQA